MSVRTVLTQPHYTREGLPIEPAAKRLRVALGAVVAIGSLIVTLIAVAY
ncbi:MAG: hypothetical protein HYV09_40070 [Deltaproteobacteria bacterium]|nr:hypothetical protein [Deltaproteobacteria bacterium]